VDKNYGQIPLPHDYNENAMHLLVQSPRVLYAYWELSPGLKNVFSEKKGVQIRLNAQGRGPYCTTDLDMSKRSHYFSGVEPGRSYNCEIGIVNNGNEFYPLLRSNSVVAPLERPAEKYSPGQDPDPVSPATFSSSSWSSGDKK
jgi:hypothetical protein